MPQQPCARHPSNHALVQELALHTALGEAHALPFSSGHGSDSASHGLWSAARQWALSDVAALEAVTYSKKNPLHPSGNLAARSLVHHRLAVASAGTTTDDVCPYMAPERLVSLYAPLTVLPPLPDHVHDPVLYDHAVHHEALLSRLLASFGVRVSLTGRTRRGCPVGHQVEVLLSLTAAAEAELAEAARAAAETGHDGNHTCTPLRKESATAALHAVSSAPSRGTVDDQHASLLTDAHPRLPTHASFIPSESCSATETYASRDTFSTPVVYRYHRALQGLAHAGYLVAGRLPSQEACEKRIGIPFSVRFDPQCPTRCPPHQLCYSPTLARLRLHRLVICVAPRRSLVARQFFLTGPAAFTSHVTLKALARGYDLNMNGLFTRAHSDGGRSRSESHTCVGLRSEVDLFRAVGLPYVDPFNRSMYCQINQL